MRRGELLPAVVVILFRTEAYLLFELSSRGAVYRYRVVACLLSLRRLFTEEKMPPFLLVESLFLPVEEEDDSYSSSNSTLDRSSSFLGPGPSYFIVFL